jgi:hypothetical protein
MEELQRNRDQSRKPAVKNPEMVRRLESLRLARKELARSLESATHEARRSQLKAALVEIDRQIAEAEKALS